ncbi:MAG: molybdopterin-dependent oxidoreductase [Actinobacteria bacterium]|nr:molybdopterin-dependent oxidoreductase [Actinomycetota bacterium]
MNHRVQSGPVPSGLATRSRMVLLGSFFVVAAALLAGSCSSGNEDSSSTTTAKSAPTTENPYGADIEVDPPAPGESVLTVTGPAGEKIYSLEQIAALGPETVTINEPFVNKKQTFTAVPMEALLAPSGLTGSQMIDTTAINEYVYSNTAESFVSGGTLLAYELDGKPIPYDQGGPVRIIFADDAPGASNLDAWNWSLSSISAQ